MDEVSLVRLKDLSVEVEKLANRYDIDKSVYEDIYREHEKVHLFIEINPAHFQSAKEHTEAFCLSSYIMICLLTRINEFNETGDY